VPSGFDPTEILRVLLEHEVDFVVVGGVAATLAGSPLVTRDLDLVFGCQEENLERLVRVLRLLDATYKDPAGRRIIPDEGKLARIRVNLLTTRLGDLDLLQEIGAGLDYTALIGRTVDYEIGDRTFRAIDLSTLIESKTVADRPKDHHALPFLRELLRLTEESNPEKPLSPSDS
jgi:hypothetical protein